MKLILTSANLVSTSSIYYTKNTAKTEIQASVCQIIIKNYFIKPYLIYIHMTSPKNILFQDGNTKMTPDILIKSENKSANGERNMHFLFSCIQILFLCRIFLTPLANFILFFCLLISLIMTFYWTKNENEVHIKSIRHFLSIF